MWLWSRKDGSAEVRGDAEGVRRDKPIKISGLRSENSREPRKDFTQKFISLLHQTINPLRPTGVSFLTLHIVSLKPSPGSDT